MTTALPPAHVLAYVEALNRRSRAVLLDGDAVVAGDADLAPVVRAAFGGRAEVVGEPHPAGRLTAASAGPLVLGVVCAGATPPPVTLSDLRAALSAAS